VISNLRLQIAVFNKISEVLNWKLYGCNCTAYSVSSGLHETARFIVMISQQANTNRATILSAMRMTDKEDEFIGSLSYLMVELKQRVDTITVWSPRGNQNQDLYKKAGFIKYMDIPMIILPLSSDEDVRRIVEDPDHWSPELIEIDTLA